MERQTCSGLLSVLLLVVFSGDSAHAEVKPVYFGLGQSLNLSLPVATTERLTSLLWKFNDNLLAEWVENVIPLEYYGRFKGRTTLDVNTGRLIIRNMGEDDIGLYSVEVNNRVQDDKYRATVVEEVPTPKILVQPLSCSSHSDSCNLNCDGDTTKTGPVTYSWKKGDGAWEVSEKVLNIINNETQKIKTFSCRMENLLGTKDSEPKTNPFLNEEPGDTGSSVGGVVGGVFGGLLLLVLIALVLFWKFKLFNRIRGWISRRGKDNDQNRPTEKNDDNEAGNGGNDELRQLNAGS